jgi:sporulation protein YlmC with PRC-barrel domain
MPPGDEEQILARIDTKERLIAMDDTDRTVADPAEDIRGRKIFDRAGEEIGDVDDLILDDREGKVRFIRVAAGGFLGLGERHFLIPVDAITSMTKDRISVDQTRERIVGAPIYDPETVPEDTYWNDLYGYYGFAPYWAPGYAYPAYPYDR